MKRKPIVINTPVNTPAPPSPSDVRAASFNEDQTPAENSFLGRYYRPNRNTRGQNMAPPPPPPVSAAAAGGGGGSAPSAPVVTQAQPNNADSKMGQQGYDLGRNIYSNSSSDRGPNGLAPTTSPRPQPRPTQAEVRAAAALASMNNSSGSSDRGPNGLAPATSPRPKPNPNRKK